MLIDTRQPDGPGPWEPDWGVWWRGTLAAVLGLTAFSTSGLLSLLAIFAAIYFACRAIDIALPYHGGLKEWRQ